MTYWWKENRTFVVPVAAGVAVLLLWYAIAYSGLRGSAADLRRRREAAERDARERMMRGVPSDAVLARAEQDLERSKRVLEELARGCALALPGEYEPPAGRDPGEHWSGLKESVRGRLKTLFPGAAHRETEGDFLGFPPIVGPRGEFGRELLERLRVIERCATAAAAAKVRRIVSIDAGVQPEDASSPAEPGAFVRVRGVRIRAEGTSRAIFEWVHALQQKDAYLAVRDFSLTRATPHEDAFIADVEVAGIVVRPTAQGSQR